MTKSVLQRILEACATGTDELRALAAEYESARATPEEVAEAREAYQDDDLEIDDDALASRPEDDDGFWVQAWVWLAREPEDEEDDDDDSKPMADFIKEHRAELEAGINRVTGKTGPVDDDEIEQWIANDEGLYLWAKREGVDV